MNFFLVFLIVFIILVAAFIKASIKIVSQSDILIIERLGKFHATLNSGFYLITPFIDQVRAKFSIREQLVDISKQQVITKDNVNISVDGIVFLKITDAKMALYNVENYKQAIASLAMTTLRGEIGALNLDDTLSSRDKLNASLQIALGDAANNWGIKIMRVEISEISVPKSIEEAMNLQMKAEREKRAIELKAEADKSALIKNAEALKQEKVLQAEAIERMADAKKYEQIANSIGQSESILNLAKAMQEGGELPNEFILAKSRIEAFSDLAKSDSKDKIIVPLDLANFIGSLSIAKDLLKKGE